MRELTVVYIGVMSPLHITNKKRIYLLIMLK